MHKQDKIYLRTLGDYKSLDDLVTSFTLKYNGINLDYLLRNHLVTLLRTRENQGNKEIKLSKEILKRLIKAFVFSLTRIFFKRNYWVFSNAERRKKINGFYIDRVGSILSEYSKKETIYIENPIITNHKNPTEDFVFSDAFFYLFSFLFSFLFYKKKNLTFNKELFDFTKVNDINLSIEPIVKRFVGQYHFMKWWLRIFPNPKIVFLVYPNGYYGYTYAFKQKNIPVVELQHGIIYPLHYAYNTTDTIDARLFKPDHVFVYGNKDKECLIALGYLPATNIHIVGSYALWKQLQIKSSPSGYLSGVLDKRFKTLLITATTNDVSELYSFAKRLEQYRKDLNILLLPRHRVSVEYIDGERLRVLDVDKVNVFESYEVADYHLTINSTCALESLYFNIPTFVLDIVEVNIFKENYGYIDCLNYVVSEKEFAALINEEKYIKPSINDVEKIYAYDVVENFTRSINQISKEC